jgi:hypothetical protein
MAFLATELRPPRADGGERITRLAAETGAEGIHLGADCDLEIVARAPLVRSALRLGLSIPSLTLPLAERVLPAGRRLPRLAAAARDEREAAIALTESGIAAAASFGAARALLDFGAVALAADPARFALDFARRAVAPAEPGGALLAAAVAERRARSPEILDACLFSVERLVRAADRAGLALAAQLGVTPWQSPSPREIGILRETFGGALGVAWDPARLSVLGALGLPVGDDRLHALAAAALTLVDNDAVGLGCGYLPGLGERDAGLEAHPLPDGVPRVVLGGPDASDTEIATVSSGPAARGDART